MKWNIGNVEIANQVVLAPMAGICDSAFRRIIKSMGCGLIETEMVSNNAIKYKSRRTDEMLYMTDFERPISQQIFGSEPEIFKIASKHVYNTMKPDIIDINMGCPVTKVAVKSHAGSALLKNPEKAGEIIKSTVESVPIPVTAKIRSGWDENSINAVEIARTIEENGASAISVHPRTRQDKYDVPSDWSVIKDVKDAVDIPVIGNGDIRTCYDAEEMIAETGCDAVMIGRGVLGNPWLIRQCIDYLDCGIKPEKVTLTEKVAMMKKHAELLIKTKNEKIAIHKMRTHATYYLKNEYKTIETKKKIFKCNTKDELFKVIDDYVYQVRKN